MTHKSILVLTAIAALSTTSLVPAHAATRGAVHAARAASHRPIGPANREKSSISVQ